MNLPIFLFLFPLFIALILLAAKNNPTRRILVWSAAIVLCVSSILLLVFNFHREVQYLNLKSAIIDRTIFFSEIILGAYLVYLGLRSRRYSICFLAFLQTLLIIALRIYMGISAEIAHDLFIDRLSLVMSLIIGITGSTIALYAIGYMHDYHALNPQFKDRRKFFFFTLFLFISAMFGLVFSNNLTWLFFFWEVTTLCSFLLIGYNQSQESRQPAFKALEFNLLGGVAFLSAIFYLYVTQKTIELDKLMLMDKSVAMLAVALISFAGIIKSAQPPFSSWLLGAMVAPGPVSALLHSSTMVKAGVYVILRLVLILDQTTVGYSLALIGGISFLVTSIIAVTQSDAKRVLAYSTVANLGLILLCAGLGTAESVWAAVLLIVFHAFTKCLLFLCLGVVEDKLQSRDIEDMSGLILTMPRLASMMQMGIAGMFLAPLGMFVSKWAVIQATVDYNPILAIFVVFGSTITVLFWVKWLGRLVVVVRPRQASEEGIHSNIWLPLEILSALIVVLVGLFPFASELLIEPYVIEIYHRRVELGHNNFVIMAVMLGLIVLFRLAFFRHAKSLKETLAYLGGANAQTSTDFYGAYGQTKQIEMRSYYFDRYFDEQKLYRMSVQVCSLLILAMFGLSLL